MQASIRVKSAAPWRRNEPRAGVQHVQSFTTEISLTPAFRSIRHWLGAGPGAVSPRAPYHRVGAELGGKAHGPFLGDRVAAGADTRPDGCGDIAWLGTEGLAHCADSLPCNSCSFPTRVHKAESARCPIHEEDRQAIGNCHCKERIGSIGDHPVCLRPGKLSRLLALQQDDRQGVDLADGESPFGGDAQLGEEPCTEWMRKAAGKGHVSARAREMPARSFRPFVSKEAIVEK